MPGFTLVKGKLKNGFLDIGKEKLLVESLNYEDIKIQRRTLRKFLEDKVFYQDENYLILTEGVIFNKTDLVKKYKKENFKDTIIEMYKNKEEFFLEFRGTFSGVFIDKVTSKTLIYTDHIGNKKLYYSIFNNQIIIGYDLYEITDILRKNNKEYSFNKEAAYSLLIYGSMLENITLINEIKFLKAGQYIKIENENIEVLRYHKLTQEPIEEKTEDEIIEKIDFLFKQAMKRQYLKNEEYNYLNIAPLSAGLDSRTTNFALKELCKDKEVINITYSQNNYLDEKIPKVISKDLKNHWIFKSLNNGLSLKLIEEVNKITNGIILSYGACQTLDIVKYLNFENIGVIHTGMFGECLAGGELDYTTLGKASEICTDRLKIKKSKIERYDNFEIFNYYNGSFLKSFMGSPKIFQEITESFSPFYDVDFVQYTLNIPAEIRKNHNIYDKWLLKKYPESCKYLANGRKIGSKVIKLFGRDIPIHQVLPRGINFLLNKMKCKKESFETKKSMNPLDLWYEKNIQIKNYFDFLFNKFINEIEDNEIKKDCKELYINGNTLEKDLVLTFLLSYKNLFVAR